MERTEIPAEIGIKYEKLKDYFRELGTVVVAFSGGVDSTFLLSTARDVLGDKAVAVTAAACSFPQHELQETEKYCAALNIRQIMIPPSELKINTFAHNPKNRCYLCKRQMFEKIRRIADGLGIREIIEGSNADDANDYRPGRRALAELEIKSPLHMLGFTKQEIRDLSKILGIPTWGKPSYACLFSRFPYGEYVTEEKLKKVEQAEQILHDYNFALVRVRVHGNVARIEAAPEAMMQMMQKEIRENIYQAFRDLGFDFVALDLMGYRTGSMNIDMDE